MAGGIEANKIVLNNAISGASTAIGRTVVLAAGVAVALALLGSSGAMAQNCGNTTLLGFNALAPLSAGLAGANVIAGSISAANTAFLTQSTAFVSAPGNPAPNSEGGGLWTRGVGGSLNMNTAQSGTVVLSGAGVPGSPLSGSATCTTSFHQTFAGFQVGQDVANLNVNGWNLHLGTTAGFLQTQGNLPNGNLLGGSFDASTQAPFVGTYAVATSGGFFVDGMIRFDYYQTTLNSPSLNLFNPNFHPPAISAIPPTGIPLTF